MVESGSCVSLPQKANQLFQIGQTGTLQSAAMGKYAWTILIFQIKVRLGHGWQGGGGRSNTSQGTCIHSNIVLHISWYRRPLPFLTLTTMVRSAWKSWPKSWAGTTFIPQGDYFLNFVLFFMIKDHHVFVLPLKYVVSTIIHNSTLIWIAMPSPPLLRGRCHLYSDITTVVVL